MYVDTARVKFEEFSEAVFYCQGDAKTKSEIIKNIREKFAGCTIVIPAIAIQTRDIRSNRIKHAISDMIDTGFSQAEIVNSVVSRFSISKQASYIWIKKTRIDRGE